MNEMMHDCGGLEDNVHQSLGFVKGYSSEGVDESSRYNKNKAFCLWGVDTDVLEASHHRRPDRMTGYESEVETEEMAFDAVL